MSRADARGLGLRGEDCPPCVVPPERDTDRAPPMANLATEAGYRALRAEQAEQALRCIEILQDELRHYRNSAVKEKRARRAGEPIEPLEEEFTLSIGIDSDGRFIVGKKTDEFTLLDALKQKASAMACDQAARKAAIAAREEAKARMQEEFGVRL